MSIELLAETINKVVKHKDINTRLVVLDNRTFIREKEEDTELDRMIKTVEDLSADLLVTEMKETDWRNHIELEKLGYPVIRGVFGTFQWLTGVIKTPVGFITYVPKRCEIKEFMIKKPKQSQRS